MLPFLLKSTACLAIFLAFYKLVLENESMHHFKRFYLMGVLLAALIIPNIVFVEYVEVSQNTSVMQTVTNFNDSPQPMFEETDTEWSLILWSIYTLGVVIFALRFFKNLGEIGYRIRKNPKLKDQSITRVLMAQQIPPHTFFRYVFLNKRQYEQHNIPEEVMLHEETHAKQRHSLDVLLIELAQVIFWFNPLIYVLKSSIKLNHEFLADQEVVNQSSDHTQYQNTLLSYLSHDCFETYQSSGIANAINYSSIKKRFTVMKTNTSKTSFMLRSFLLLPLTAMLLFGFSSTNKISVAKEPTVYPSMDEMPGTKDLISRSIELAGIIVDSETLLPIENASIMKSDGQILTKTDNNGYYHVEFEILTSGEIYFDLSVIKKGYNPILQKEHWGNLQGKIGSAMYFALQQTKSNADELSTLVANTKNLDYGTILKSYNKVEADFIFRKKLKKAKKGNQNVFIQLDGGYFLVNDSWIRLKSKNDLVIIDDKTILPAFKLNEVIKRNQVTGMTPLEAGSKADYAIYTLKSTVSISQNQQKSASREEMKEYNALAKKYNAMDSNHMIIKKKEVMRLKLIYGKMSEKQRADAEPFPDFPAPPPAPKAPKPPKNVSDTKYASNQIKKVIATQDPYDVVGGNLTIKAPINPVPPAPLKPIEHIKEMASKGASFMFNGKEISAKKAIEVIQKNDKINIDSRNSRDKKPVVKLSVDPIEIEN